MCDFFSLCLYLFSVCCALWKWIAKPKSINHTLAIFVRNEHILSINSILKRLQLNAHIQITDQLKHMFWHAIVLFERSNRIECIFGKYSEKNGSFEHKSAQKYAPNEKNTFSTKYRMIFSSINSLVANQSGKKWKSFSARLSEKKMHHFEEN